MKFLNKAVKIFLMITFLNSCAAIPANKIKLENYPKIEDLENLSLSYEQVKFEPNKKGFDISQNIIKTIDEKFKKNKPAIKNKKINHSNCSVKISAMHYASFPRTCIVNYFLAGFTLFTIPFYCQHTFEAHATLISYPKDSETRGHNIKLSINQAKLGDFFLDENDRPAKLLKTYELKDKVHEVWSLLWMLSWFVYNPESSGTPEGAKKLTEENISEALVRSILNDASTFEECQKDQPSSGKKK
jgi:hypothetical protein